MNTTVVFMNTNNYECLGSEQVIVSWFTGFLYFVLYFTPLILTLIT
jgi:hypothetical protein